MKDADFFKGLWTLIKHGEYTKLEIQKLEQKERELQHFVGSQNQQVQLYSKQIELMQKQADIMEKQAKIQRQTMQIYIIIAILTFLTAIATFIMALKR